MLDMESRGAKRTVPSSRPLVSVDYIFSQFQVNKITAETDDDAFGFYKKYGFTVIDTKLNRDIKRYVCECIKKVNNT